MRDREPLLRLSLFFLGSRWRSSKLPEEAEMRNSSQWLEWVPQCLSPLALNLTGNTTAEDTVYFAELHYRYVLFEFHTLLALGTTLFCEVDQLVFRSCPSQRAFLSSVRGKKQTPLLLSQWFALGPLLSGQNTCSILERVETIITRLVSQITRVSLIDIYRQKAAKSFE